MLFNSFTFLVFATTFFLFWSIFNRNNNARWVYLTIASFVFYGWWDWRFLFLIVGSGLIDYASGWAMVWKPSWRKLFLWLSLLGNLGSLAVFKYSVFFAIQIDALLSSLNIQTRLIDHIPEFALILPVGISFFTFQSMSYTIDIYRGRLKPATNVFHFFSYLSMFPQLVAGPIVRARDMLQQLAHKRQSSWLQKWHGIKLIVFGLFQKTVIADNLGVLVDTAYQGKTSMDGGLFWFIVLIAFSFQIYCDFSGYSLIARGLAKYMGYHFKMNFNHPYLATSLRDFWTRWHISLSTWFRDYVYIPLGGSKKGFWLGIVFMSITMILSGLWHGAAITFILWGAIHALFLAIERITNWPIRLKALPVPGIVVRVIVWLQVVMAWNYFRAVDASQAHAVFSKLTSGWSGFDVMTTEFLDPLIFLVLAIAIEFAIYVRNRFPQLLSYYRFYSLDVAFAAVSLAAVIYLRGPNMSFIYFQF